MRFGNIRSQGFETCLLGGVKQQDLENHLVLEGYTEKRHLGPVKRDFRLPSEFAHKSRVT